MTGFSVGDRVYGRMPLGKIGAFAEYAAVDSKAVAKIPEYLTDEECVTRLGADRFIDYRKEDYSKVLSDVDYVLDTLGEKELEKEFSILKRGRKAGLPSGPAQPGICSQDRDVRIQKDVVWLRRKEVRQDDHGWTYTPEQ